MHSAANSEIHFLPQRSWAIRTQGPCPVTVNIHDSGHGRRGHFRRQQLQISTVASRSGIDLTTVSRFTNSACCLALDGSRTENGFGTQCHGLGLSMKLSSVNYVESTRLVLALETI